MTKRETLLQEFRLRTLTAARSTKKYDIKHLFYVNFVYIGKDSAKKRKTESGKRKTFIYLCRAKEMYSDFRLEWESGTDARSKSRGCLQTMPCKKEEKPA